MIYVAGPGHGGPGVVANTISRARTARSTPTSRDDADGMQPPVQAVLVPRRHSQPRRVRRRRARSTRAASSATRCRTRTARRSTTRTWSSPASIGDGEAETGPLRDVVALEQVPEPGTRRRGAADPAPQRLQDREPDACSRASDATSFDSLLDGLRLRAATSSRATTRATVHQRWRAALDAALDEIAEIQGRGAGAGAP